MPLVSHFEAGRLLGHEEGSEEGPGPCQPGAVVVLLPQVVH